MRRNALALVVLALPLSASPAFAQLMASERGSVSQTIDGITTTVNYSRPMARGRTGLFGTRVHWGEIWTPGANEATRLTVTKDITIEAQPVPKGSYSVWIVVGRGPWEMVLDQDTSLYHDQTPRPRPGQIRFAVSREQRPFMEGLTWWFPQVRGNSAILAVQWDTVYVPLHIKVPSSYSTAVAPAVARRLAGVYQVHFEPDPIPADTTLDHLADPITPALRFTIRQEGTELRGVMDPPLYQGEDGYRDWILIPIRGGSEYFHLGRLLNGELIEVFGYFALQFDSAGDRAATFEARETNDRFMGKGTRVP